MKIDWIENWENFFGEVVKLIVYTCGCATIIDPQGYEHPFPTYEKAEDKLYYLGYR